MLAVIVLIAVGVCALFFTNLGMVVYSFGRPLWGAESFLMSPFRSFTELLHSKQALLVRNHELLKENADLTTKAADRDLLKAENETLRELFNRKPEAAHFIIADILARPGFFSYDSLVLDVGLHDGVLTGQTVYANEYVPIGTVSNVGGSVSTAVLFSNPGMETPVLIGEGTTTPGMAVGKGGGNFEVRLPRSVTVSEGDPIRLAARSSIVLGTVSAIVNNPSDSFEKALFTLPINIQEITTVLIEKKP